jgi:hypothetical protein
LKGMSLIFLQLNLYNSLQINRKTLMLQPFKPQFDKDPSINLLRVSADNTFEEEYDIDSSASGSDHEYVTLY